MWSWARFSKRIVGLRLFGTRIAEAEYHRDSGPIVMLDPVGCIYRRLELVDGRQPAGRVRGWELFGDNADSTRPRPDVVG
jgi:hypothetical protein